MLESGIDPATVRIVHYFQTINFPIENDGAKIVHSVNYFCSIIFYWKLIMHHHFPIENDGAKIVHSVDYFCSIIFYWKLIMHYHFPIENDGSKIVHSVDYF